MRFMKNYGRVAHSALAYAMNDEFSRVLHQQMEFFSSNPSADTLNRLRGEVSEASTYLLIKLSMFGILLGFRVLNSSSLWYGMVTNSNSCRYTPSWLTT